MKLLLPAMTLLPRWLPSSPVPELAPRDLTSLSQRRLSIALIMLWHIYLFAHDSSSSASAIQLYRHQNSDHEEPAVGF